jgi:hypothetical protein
MAMRLEQKTATRVRHSLMGRYRLMRGRVNERIQPNRILSAIGISIFVGLVATLVEWLGYVGNFRHTGVPVPREFSYIWWHPFPAAAFCLGCYFVWPFRD